MSDFQILRLSPDHAAAIVDCFHRVYGGSYANEDFAQSDSLKQALLTGRIGSVGAVSQGRVYAHMAMTVRSRAINVELGNTVVDPEARGEGLAWLVGAELTRWSKEKGFGGYLHYPTTDHHIMQRQSVKQGFETGVMLGYIPAETDSHVSTEKKTLRSAATIVYEPLDEKTVTLRQYLPDRYAELLQELATPTGLSRQWDSGNYNMPAESLVDIETKSKRSLCRMTITQSGQDLREHIDRLLAQRFDCLQIDFSMSDVNISTGVEQAIASGAVFCGWLPGFSHSDILRMQWFNPEVTDLRPQVVNPVAQNLLEKIVS